MSCTYLTTGDLECIENFDNIQSKLGEDCTVKPCAQGECVSPYGTGRGAYCYNVVKKGEKNCEKSFAICEPGYSCEDNTCVLNTNVKVDELSKEDEIDYVKEEQQPSENKQFQATLSFYIFLGLIALLLAGALYFTISYMNQTTL
jgi:hypothetical protein